MIREGHRNVRFFDTIKSRFGNDFFFMAMLDQYDDKKPLLSQYLDSLPDLPRSAARGKTYSPVTQKETSLLVQIC